MSPPSLRLYRAERMLKQDFARLRAAVLGSVRARLRAGGMSIDESDLEACYATAWQGLYASVLQGEEIANARGWLVVVTYRRAVEEHRAGVRQEALAPAGRSGTDLEAELDDRIALRRLLEGMRGHLDLREREAAALCYLQGYSRAEAARRMGISEIRMRKLMEGRGRGRGVAAKVGALVESIKQGGFCAEQASLMRALAYGMLDQDGERYRLAVMHSSGCPSCRRYVATLRGAAAALPPVLTHPALAGGALAGLAGIGHAVAGGGAGATPLGGGAAAGAAGTPAGGLGVSASAGGAAGGGWAVASGGVGAKLLAGCLLAIGIGTGCAVLAPFPQGHGAPRHAHVAGARAAPVLAGSARALTMSSGRSAGATTAPGGRDALHGGATAAPRSDLGAAVAGREFSPEQPAGPASVAQGQRSPGVVAARSSRPPAPGGHGAGPGTGAAAREFSPG